MKIKYFLDPPTKKKRLRDTNGRNMATRTSVCLYQQPVTWIFTPFIVNYYLSKDGFSRLHLSICDIFHTKENTRSFNVRATHFKG